VPEGKGMASLYTMSDWAEELIKEDDDTVLRKIIEAGERVVPGLADGMEFSHINRWYPVIVYSQPGDYKKLIPLKQLLAQNPRIAFAGDYFSCSNLNTAIAGGERAAREICAEFGRN
jgi:oxygen-dependent protoporphyrinogen oxidase